LGQVGELIPDAIGEIRAVLILLNKPQGVHQHVIASISITAFRAPDDLGIDHRSGLSIRRTPQRATSAAECRNVKEPEIIFSHPI
jgi:hypothetical protein